MKTSSRFIILFIISSLLFTAVCSVSISIAMNQVKKSEYYTYVSIADNIRKKNPQFDENEIVQILNEASDNITQTKDDLRTYGITEEDWIVYENEKNSKNVVLVCTVISITFGTIISLLFLFYCRKQKMEIISLTQNLNELNKGKYDLMPENNTEDEHSLLRNELYKTTVMLREQSEKSLKAKEGLKDTISDISHQLKTPLTSITVMLENLIDDPEMPAEIRLDFLNDIRLSANHISFLVKSLLRLSRFDADVVEFNYKQEKTDDLFSDCIKNTEIMAELKGVNVLFKKNRDIVLNCDRRWLSEGLTNIVKNCIENTPSGGSVVLSAVKNKLYTRITIKDTGCGIDKDTLPHIFERFYSGKKSDENSIGIGLSLTKAIVTKHGGYISASSVPGEGSCFTLSFFHNS